MLVLEMLRRSLLPSKHLLTNLTPPSSKMHTGNLHRGRVHLIHAVINTRVGDVYGID